MNSVPIILRWVYVLRSLLLVLTGVSSFALAGWEQVGANDAIYMFADRSTIRREGTKVRMWHLIDHRVRPSESGVSYQSSKVEAEYECRENRFQELSAAFYPFRMAEGEMISSVAGGRGWQPIIPESAAALLADIACERSKRELKSRKK